MPLPTVGSLWREFWDTLRPVGVVDDEQRREVRRCFYAGYVECLKGIRNASADPAINGAILMRYLESQLDECVAFFALVKEGKA
jgi:hypothetical protein